MMIDAHSGDPLVDYDAYGPRIETVVAMHPKAMISNIASHGDMIHREE
jgi:hypothetical protein